MSRKEGRRPGNLVVRSESLLDAAGLITTPLQSCNKQRLADFADDSTPQFTLILLRSREMSMAEGADTGI